jgi:hemoglobin-like flavoprotein
MPDMTDHQLLERSLEALAEVTEDISPPVYERFFGRHPETRALFVDELGRGRMVMEILQTCLELAEGRSYAPGSIASLASDHTSYGDIPLQLYRDLLDDLLQTMAELVGPCWTPQVARAWRRQTGRIVAVVAGALRRPAVQDA